MDGKGKSSAMGFNVVLFFEFLREAMDLQERHDAGFTDLNSGGRGKRNFFMFACVCKPWREAVIAMKQEFKAAQGPLLFFMSTNARKIHLRLPYLNRFEE
ncbi:hypothetical protein COLO4_30138 [Corchorus olitorius]|uniref:Uncharacterized protein n=1 Tax=Corchorus olitorius TaxID=93759 RepID=A0A1R3HAW7_9ROSI|nr:hypothetical protein COLO4_30138 [Corchorus olitorius]